jgi:membrane peptidoglycan carboxypeptidase
VPRPRKKASAQVNSWRKRIGTPAVIAAAVAIISVPVLVFSSGVASASLPIFQDGSEEYEIGAQPQVNRIVAYSGKREVTIATVYSQNRQEITWDDVTPQLKNAALAAEDHRFYEHGAIDPQGLVRAAFSTLSGDLQGGSTLTQQLVKNICIADAFKEYPNSAQDEEEFAKYQKAVEACQETSLDRKLSEMKAAVELEKKYSKDEILLAYLNIANYGGTVYGIQSAAQRYYDKDAKDLTTVEAASLVSIVQTPSTMRLDIEENYPTNTDRRNFVLANELKYGYITQAEYDEAVAVEEGSKNDTLKITDPRNGCVAANMYAKQFCDYVVKNVKNYAALGDTEKEREYNWRVGGYTLYTTLDLRLQKVSQNTIEQYAPKDETLLKLGSANSVVEAGTGRILVMAQNKPFDDTGNAKKGATAVNFNTDKEYGGSSGFQVGSTYKVFTLINWLAHGHSLGEYVNGSARTVQQSEFTDTCNDPGTWGGPYQFKNDGGEGGTMSVQNATANSVNGAFISMALELDLCDTKKIAQSLGVHLAAGKADGSDIETNPSSVLGTNYIAPLTMAAAYAAIANDGVYCAPIAVDRIVDRTGAELPGQTEECKRGIDKDVAIATQQGLKLGMSRYPSNPYDGTVLIGKTGTTDNSNQTWVTSASTKAASTVWFGNIRGDYPIRSYPSGGTYGGNQRHAIQKAVLTKMDQLYKGGDWETPDPVFIVGKRVPVGNYIGMTESEARAAIQADGLYVGSVTTIESDAPEGEVAEQSPGKGYAPQGTPVSLSISDGSAASVPDVTGTSVDSAQAELDDDGWSNVETYCVPSGDTTSQDSDGDGLVDGTQEAVTEGDADGTVVEQAPEPGTVKGQDRLVRLGVAQADC